MKEIPLTQGYVAIVDDEDYERVIAHKWQYLTGGYAKTDIENQSILLHRFVLGLGRVEDRIYIDHKNLNKLDCRKSNLRYATHQQNNMHKPKYFNEKSWSIYKGVTYDKKIKRWKAAIKHNGKRIHIGVYSNQEEAALAYNEMARKLFGEFAWLNTVGV